MSASNGPRLRNEIEAIPIQQDGKRMFVLRDVSGLAPDQLVVSAAVVYILHLFDGSHDLAAVSANLKKTFDDEVPVAQLEELVTSLDKAHFLAGAGLDAFRRAKLDAFRAAPSRPFVHSGVAYPCDAAEFAAWSANLAKISDPAARGTLVGAAAPHIDLRFGGRGCRAVHDQRAERRSDADVIVVLGTGHAAGDDLFTLTRQDFATPLGTVATDRELVDAIARKAGGDELFRSELLHASEHTVEFQSVFVPLAGAAATRPRILPVLVGSLHRHMTEGKEPWSDVRMKRFVEALGEEADRLKRRVVHVASIDLSHMGPRYGDPTGLTPDEATQVEREDRELLGFAERGDPEGFFFHNQKLGDRRRVCGFSALYTLLRLLPGARGRVLDYTQTTFPDSQDTVAHCAMVFEKP